MILLRRNYSIASAKNHQSGILIVELIIAVGLFLAIGGSLVMLATRSYTSYYQATDSLVAQNMINDKYSELKQLKQEDFDKLDEEFPNDTFIINERAFQLTTVISPVYRGASGKIDASLDNCDLWSNCENTKRATFTVNWKLIQGKSTSQTMVVYFTKWENQ